MANFIQSVDARTQLAGANRLEILLFSLGLNSENNREEVFGINVFKVREVMNLPEITRAPDMPPGVVGFVSLRGQMIPVVDLAHFCNVNIDQPPSVLIITEYNKSIQGFLVNSVEQILRMEWNDIKVPPSMLAHRLGGLVTAVSELQDNRIVMILDVEKVLAETSTSEDDEHRFEGIDPLNVDATVVYADDSSVARKQIEQTLDHIGVKHIGTKNGIEAWDKLQELASRAEKMNIPMHEMVSLILTDIEMPGMDGYVLTRKVKDDNRFRGIPIIMHSSLSADANMNLGKTVGADGYVAKFDPQELVATIKPYLVK